MQVACSREGIHGLPVDLLAEVLQHVEQTERLGCCSLVCKIWQQAAKLATSKVEFTFDAEQGLGSLTAWLKSNKFLNKLTSIIIGDDTAHDPALPVPSLELDCVQLEQLTSLELCGCHVKAVTATDESHAHSAAVMTSAAETVLPYAAAAGTAGRTPVTASNLKSLGALTALNSLDLVDTCLDLDELSCCTGLQWLGMCNVRHITTEPAEDTAPDFRVQASPTLCPTPQIACALPALMQLTHLNISHKYCQDDEEQQQLASIICASIGNLRQLRSLRLGLKSITADHLAHLPNRLTALYIADAPQLTFAKTPQLAQMTGLRELGVIGSPSIDALLLSTVTQLTRLVIVTSDRSPVAEDELLTALQRLQLLKSLQLPGCFEQDSPMLDLYAALTISCELEELDLRNCIIPPNAFPFMFPPSRVRQHLTTVHITSDLLGSIDNCEYLIGCCPALVEFRMKDLRLLPARAGLVDVQVSLRTGVGVVTGSSLSPSSPAWC